MTGCVAFDVLLMIFLVLVSIYAVLGIVATIPLILQDIVDNWKGIFQRRKKKPPDGEGGDTRWTE